MLGHFFIFLPRPGGLDPKLGSNRIQKLIDMVELEFEPFQL